MTQKSHIQLPRFILKRFMNADGEVFYLDCNDFSIQAKGPRMLGQEQGYYSSAMEDYLDKNIEDPFGKLVAKVLPFAEGKRKCIRLDAESVEVCKRYITAAMIRSRLALHVFMKGSITAQLFPDQVNHDELVFLGIQNEHGASELLQSYKLVITVNHTDCMFVVPQNSYFIASSCDMPCVVIPVSPVLAFQLVPQDYPAILAEGEECRHCRIHDPATVKIMNIAALKYEYMFNHGFVVSYREQELIELKSFAKDRMEDLMDLYDSVHQKMDDL